VRRSAFLVLSFTLSTRSIKLLHVLLACQSFQDTVKLVLVCILPSAVSPANSQTEQCAVLLPLLQRFGITTENLGYFVLDNALNNDTTLVELAKVMKFDPKQKRLRCIGHIINLIAGVYLFGQDEASFDEEYKRAGPADRRRL
jgi:hypothetical protein